MRTDVNLVDELQKGGDKGTRVFRLRNVVNSVNTGLLYIILPKSLVLLEVTKFLGRC